MRERIAFLRRRIRSSLRVTTNAISVAQPGTATSAIPGVMSQELKKHAKKKHHSPTHTLIDSMAAISGSLATDHVANQTLGGCRVGFPTSINYSNKAGPGERQLIILIKED